MNQPLQELVSEAVLKYGLRPGSASLFDSVGRKRRRDSILAELRHHEYAARDGVTLTGEWRGMLVSMDAVCSEGHYCNPRPASIHNGQGWCLRCGVSKRSGASYSDFSFWLRSLTYEKGLVATDLAGGVGVSRSLVSSWMTGEIAPSDDNLEKIQIYLGLMYYGPSIEGQHNYRIASVIAKDDFLLLVKERGFTLTGVYRGNHRRTKLRCPNGHVCWPTPANFKNFHGCFDCQFVQVKPGSQFNNWKIIGTSVSSAEGKGRSVLCMCTGCGKKMNLFVRRVVSGRTKSCGCVSRNSRNKSGYIGVSESYGKWAVDVGYQGKRYRLGRFNTAEEAACVRDAKMRELGAPEALLNFPREA